MKYQYSPTAFKGYTHRGVYQVIVNGEERPNRQVYTNNPSREDVHKKLVVAAALRNPPETDLRLWHWVTREQDEANAELIDLIS